MKHTPRSTSQTILRSGAIILSLLFVGACAGERDAALPDGEDHVYTKQDFQVNGTLTTGDALQSSLIPGDELRVQSEGNWVQVDSVQLPKHLQPLFKDLQIKGSPRSTYAVQITINRKYVTAYKVVTDLADLTELERQIAQSRQVEAHAQLRVSSNQWAVEMFKVPVLSYGKLVRSKNDLKEETHVLRLDTNVNWTDATHVKVEALVSQRQLVGITPSNLDESKRVFLAERLDGRVTNRKDLEKYDLLLPQTPTDQLLTQVVGTKLAVSEITKRADLVDDLERHRAVECSGALKARFGEDCVTVLRFNISLSPVVAELERTEMDGTQSPTILWKPADETTRTSLVKIEVKPIPEIIDRDRFLDPSRMLARKKLAGKEFLYRRTIEDSPNTFNFTFSGISGDLEIVRFEFKKDTVQVISATPMLGGQGSTDVDSEVLVSLPARYYRELWTDTQGKALPAPRYEATSHQDSEAIAYVDWTQNKMLRVASPLAYYALEQCFQSRSEEISAVDENLSQGLLHFTLSSHYSANPAAGCTGILRAGYFDRVQANYTFKERVSFKFYRDLQTQVEESPLLDLPYDTQKKLGLGLFTYNKIKPNRFGNTGKADSEIPLPALIDLRSGKTFTYVLAGLPTQSPRLRQKIIDSTQAVVNDWNRAFAQAFAGTSLQRGTEYMKLVVEGSKDAGTLGDLDKNYIYYVGKKTASTVIGLGGAHSNPRSGVVEAASSFVYGENIRSYVERLIELEKARADYRKATKVVAAPPAPPAGGGTSLGPDEESDLQAPQTPSNVKVGPEMDSEETSKILASLKIDAVKASPLLDMDALIKDWNRSASASAPSLNENEALERLRDYAQELNRHQSAGGGSVTDDPAIRTQIMGALNGHRSAQFFQKAIDDAVRGQKLQDPTQLEVHINEALIEMLAGQIPATDLEQLQYRAEREKSIGQVLANMRNSNICVFDAAPAHQHGALDPALVKKIEDGTPLTDEEVEDFMMRVYAATLAHEIGHNMGLRHNFVGSYDQANFKFGDKDTSVRNYSSVMDYTADDHVTYDGLGPYDVAAIRTAYTGLLELNPAVIPSAVQKDAQGSFINTNVGRVNVPDGRFLHLNDLKRMANLKNWVDFSPNESTRSLLKTYQFCSDEDAGTYPTCNRFDSGSSPSTIVENAIKDYRELYALRNFANDKVRFGWWDMGSYIGRLFSTMIPVRQFLEETIYQLIVGAPMPVVQDHLRGAIGAMFFFNEVIRTPDTHSLLRGNERFVPIRLRDGSTTKVETKWTENILQDSVTDRLAVRGIEYDKVVALIMLTQRRLGFPRYEQRSLRISFPEFENLILRDIPDINRPTVSLLREVLGNNVTPAAGSPQGMISLGGGSFKVELTEMIRIFSVIGSIINLDVDGLNPTDNKSTLFRVDSGRQPPVAAPGSTALPVTYRPGLKLAARRGEELSYWSRSSASVADALVTESADLNQLIHYKDVMLPLLAAYFKKELGIPDAPKEDGAAEEALVADENTPTPGSTITSEDQKTIDAIPPPLLDNKTSAKSPCPKRCNFVGRTLFTKACEALDQVVDRCEAELNKPPVTTQEEKEWQPDPKKTAEENLNDLMTKRLPESVGPRTMAEIMPVVKMLLSDIAGIQPIIPQLPAKQRTLMVDQIRTELEQLFHEAPIFGVILAALPFDDLKLALLEDVVPSRILDVHSNVLFSDIDALNTLFYSAHEKQSRQK